MEHINKDELDRFSSYSKKVGECLLWQNSLDKDGYGSFYFRKKNRRAHRFAYYNIFGNIPEGMMIDHICKNRACVFVEHLKLVTARQNALENSNSLGAINTRKTHCKFGHSFDRKYGGVRYCSICQAKKSKRLHKKWLVEANKIKC